MGRVASRQVHAVGSDGFPADSPATTRSRKRPLAPAGAGRTQEGGDPTVREFLPWHVVAKKLAGGEPGVNADGPEVDADDLVEEDAPAPMSGICVSERDRAGSEHPASLSYRVYTLADLEARGVESSPRLSRVALEPAVAKPPPWAAWATAGRRFAPLASTALAWVTTKGQRPPLVPTLTPSFDAFADALLDAIEGVEWRKVVTGLGVGIGTAAVLLFVVLTAAELTDDLKPARSRASLSAPPAPTFTAMERSLELEAPLEPVRPTVAEPAAAVAAAEPMFELPDEQAAPARAAARKPVRRAPPANKASRTKGKLTFRNADEIFRP